MSIDKIERTLLFDFRLPEYLPEDYDFMCARADSGEAIVAYWDHPVNFMELDRDNIAFAQLHRGAILQTMVRHQDVANGTEEVISEYNDILKTNPSLNPKLIEINDGLAWVNDITKYAGKQTAKISEETTVTVTSDIPARLRMYFDEGYSLHMEGYVPVEELVRMATSMK